MTATAFEANWYRALNANERLACTAVVLPSDDRLARAQKRLAKWEGIPAFQNRPDLFAQRLTTLGADRDSLLRMMATEHLDVESWPEGARDWLWRLEKIYATPSARPYADRAASGDSGFPQVVLPLVEDAARRLRAGLASAPEQDLERLIRIVAGDLLQLLTRMVNRAMVLELNIWRLEGRLAGTSAEDRFADFLEQLNDRGTAVRVLAEYPVLARQLLRATDLWSESRLSMLRRLTQDWAMVTELIGDTAPGALVELSASGDRHHGGECVCILRFASGTRVVYKPRSLSLDVHFTALLEWLNGNGVVPHLGAPRVIDRGAYGWVSFVEAQPCVNGRQIEQFYERLGAFLAVLYALEAGDFHFENLIAAGAHPMLVDLEAMFQPMLASQQVVADKILGQEEIENSVMRCGLLPQRSIALAGTGGVDFSGIGGTGGQLLPFATPQWEQAGTDEMRLVPKEVRLPAAANRPVLDGVAANPVHYAGSIERGFAHTYRVLLARRTELLADDGPLTAFRNDVIRVVLRPTNYYGQLLREMFHPDLLRDTLNRERFLDQLWAIVKDVSGFAAVIESEKDELWNCDVPIFTASVGGTALHGGSGRIIPGFLRVTGLERVKARIERLSEDDLARQLWFIRASLSASVTGESSASSSPRFLNRDEATPAPPRVVPAGALVETADLIGARLATLAIHRGNSVNWIGLTLVGQHNWSLQPLRPDLYSGTSGVALFLGYLARATGDARHRQMAFNAWRTASNHLSDPRVFDPGIGLFSGLGGALYAGSHLAEALSDDEPLAPMATVLKRIRGSIVADRAIDVTGGLAGCVFGLLSLHSVMPSDTTLELLELSVNQLKKLRVTSAGGDAWTTAVKSSAPLAGFSHGASGIAAALAAASVGLRDSSLMTTVRSAFGYERSLFSETYQAWPDLRIMDDRRPSDADRFLGITAWCHGAPGIGMARLIALAVESDQQWEDDLRTAVCSTQRTGFGRNHSICHGDIGNLEFLSAAADRLQDEGLRSFVEIRTAELVEVGLARGWRPGVPVDAETPGLMVGLAGTGLALLRLGTARVPSVLACEPARQTNA